MGWGQGVGVGRGEGGGRLSLSSSCFHLCMRFSFGLLSSHYTVPVPLSFSSEASRFPKLILRTRCSSPGCLAVSVLCNPGRKQPNSKIHNSLCWVGKFIFLKKIIIQFY